MSLTLSKNWFQNRRAKAKQQRRQEEFENSQQQPSGQTRQENCSEQPEDEDEDDEGRQEEDDEPNKQTLSGHASDIWDQKKDASLSRSSPSSTADVRELGYASLNRALAAAEAAVQQPMNMNEKFGMAPPEMPHNALPQSAPPTSSSQPYETNLPQSTWCSSQDLQQMWASSPVNASDMSFDFGFDSSTPQTLNETLELTSPSNTSCSQTFGGVSPEVWEAPMITPTQPTHSQAAYHQPLQSPGFPMSSYASSRRPSAADSLTNNLEQIALTGSTTSVSFPTSTSVSSGASDAGTGLAARRKRPGLAPLKGEALRSRSHGALTAASPTFRQGMTPMAQALRHTKSTGYSLNNQYHYGGVRKTSLPRKSPLTASFAEADFQKFMAQRMADNDVQQQLMPINTSHVNHSCVAEKAVNHFQLHPMAQQNSQAREMPPHTQISSPPITPFQTDFLNGIPTSSMMPSSIRAQYATAADWTPPYSAGPLTNSSTSDAPLTSPDFAHYSPFPPVQYIPSLSPANPLHGEESNNCQWIFSPDRSPQHVVVNNTVINNKSPDDFKINLYEFPNQREEHAQATKQLPRPAHQQHNVFVHESANYFNKDKSPK